MKSRKRHSVSMLTICFIILAITVVLATGSPALAKKKSTELSFAIHFNPSNEIYLHALKPWAAELEKRTNGKYKVKFYLSQSLAKTKDQYDAVVKGIADMSWGLHGFNPGRFPLISVMHNPYLSPSTTVGTKALLKLYEQTPAMRKEHDDVHILYIWATLPVEIHTIKKPVRTLEDLKGMKIACQPGSTSIVEALGASPVPLPPPAWYQTLEKGVVDGIAVAYAAFNAWKLQEVAKYHTHAHMGSVTAWCAMNKNVWNGLPKDVQKIITEISRDLPVANSKAVLDAQEKLLKELAESGHELIELSPEELAKWKQAAVPVREEWVKKMDAKGLPGREVLEAAERILEEYNK